MIFTHEIKIRQQSRRKKFRNTYNTFGKNKINVSEIYFIAETRKGSFRLRFQTGRSLARLHLIGLDPVMIHNVVQGQTLFRIAL